MTVSPSKVFLEQRFSKCGTQTSSSSSSSSSIWELAGNAEISGLPSDTRNQKLLGVGQAICVFIIPPGDSDASEGLRSTALELRHPVQWPLALCDIEHFKGS